MAIHYTTQLAFAGNSLQQTTFGLPRVGDKAYYDYFSLFTKVIHLELFMRRMLCKCSTINYWNLIMLIEKFDIIEVHLLYVNWIKILIVESQFQFHQLLIIVFIWDRSSSVDC